MEEGNILDLHERKDEERRKIREEKARLARRAAIQVGTRQGLRETGSLASSREAARGPLPCVPQGSAGSRTRASRGEGALPAEPEVPRSGFPLCSCQALAARSELAKAALVSIWFLGKGRPR